MAGVKVKGVEVTKDGTMMLVVDDGETKPNETSEVVL